MVRLETGWRYGVISGAFLVAQTVAPSLSANRAVDRLADVVGGERVVLARPTISESTQVRFAIP